MKKSSPNSGDRNGGERSKRPDRPERPNRDGVLRSARAAAWRVLMRVETDGAFADLALHAELERGGLERRDRAFATELCYGTLRLRGRIDAALAQVTDRPLEELDGRVRNLLRLGAYQVLFLEGVRDAAAVSESVELVRAIGLVRTAGYTNAVLRALARRKSSLAFPDPEEDPVGALVQWGSLPEWLAERWLDELGQADALALAEACLQAPPRTIRLSAGVDADMVKQRLAGRRCTYAPRGLTELAFDPVRDPGFEKGEFSVQDEASQLVPLLVGAELGDTVIDCCAAPGGKTAQLAEQVGPRGEVIALDSHAARLSLIKRNARRLGLANVRPLQRDATQSLDLQGLQSVRRVLVDAPCSGLGVLRRNPDARWRIDADDLIESAALQLRILESAARYVEPGGVVVYSVCTMSREETSGVVARFLEAAPAFRVDDPRPFLSPRAAAELVGDDAALRTWPHRHGCDGFFAVRLVRA